MKLKTLMLENFRGFEQFQCHFSSGINVLVGLNGYGKSSLLDAIAVAYGQFLSGFGTSTDRPIRESDIHLKKVLINDDHFSMELQFPVTVSATIFEEETTLFPVHWARYRNTQKSTGTKNPELSNLAKNLANMVQSGAVPSLPLFAYYGTNRLWNQSFEPSNDMPDLAKNSRLEGYRDWNKPTTNYRSFSNWLYQETLANFEQEMKNQSFLTNTGMSKSNIYKDHLNALGKALNTILQPSGWSNVHYSATAKQVVATHSIQGDVPLSLLSDGVRNMIGMVADIARRAIQLNPQMGNHAIIDTQGIVLIDEVDMHLHPQWQRSILGSLEKAFPNIQFIVTTHSPLVISDVKGIHVNLLNNLNNAIQVPELYGQDANSVLLEIMDTDIRNAEVNEKLGDVLDAIHNSKNTKDIAKAKELLVVLDGDLPVINLELSKAKLLLRKKELKIAQNN